MLGVRVAAQPEAAPGRSPPFPRETLTAPVIARSRIFAAPLGWCIGLYSLALYVIRAKLATLPSVSLWARRYFAESVGFYSKEELSHYCARQGSAILLD